MTFVMLALTPMQSTVNAVAQLTPGLLDILAQAAPSGGGDLGDVTALATLVTQLGLSAVFLWQWRRSEGRADRMTEQLLVFLEKQGPVLAEATETLKAVQDAQVRTIDRAEPVRDDIGRAVAEVKGVAEQLREELQAIQKPTRRRSPP